MSDDPPEHVVVSARIGRETHARLRWHRPVFADGTFRTLCSADQQMDQPVLARYADITTEPRRRFGEPTDVLRPCRSCQELHEAQDTDATEKVTA